jgi:hypothetical protein
VGEYLAALRLKNQISRSERVAEVLLLKPFGAQPSIKILRVHPLVGRLPVAGLADPLFCQRVRAKPNQGY